MGNFLQNASTSSLSFSNSSWLRDGSDKLGSGTLGSNYTLLGLGEKVEKVGLLAKLEGGSIDLKSPMLT